MNEQLEKIANAVKTQRISLRDISIQDVENFYWEAMQAVGWPTGKGHKFVDSSYPGYKFIGYTNLSGFSFLDKWSDPHTYGKSTGETIICFQEIPVWVMNYGGQYPKEVIPFLKLALMEVINSRDFAGGRGPKRKYTNEKYPDLSYENLPIKNHFSEFWGEEIIFGKNSFRNHIEGTHRYQGMSLI